MSSRETVPVSAGEPRLSLAERAARGEAPLIWFQTRINAEIAPARRLPTLDALSAEPRQIGVVRRLAPFPGDVGDAVTYQVADGQLSLLRVISEGAQSLRLHFTGAALPSGARLFVSSAKQREEFYGPYKDAGPNGDGSFRTPPIQSEEVVIEYFLPSGALSGLAVFPFTVSEVSHCFADPVNRAALTAPDGAAGLCHREVAAEWESTARSVGLLRFTKAGKEFICTGTLLVSNNRGANGQLVPFLLTANHCFDSQASAQSLRVYWLYGSGDSPSNSLPITDGASLLAKQE